MYEDYIIESNIVDKNEAEKKQELIVSIIKTKQELEKSNRNFDKAEIIIV